MKESFKRFAGIFLSAVMALLMISALPDITFAGVVAPEEATFMYMGENSYSDGAFRVTNVTDQDYVDVTSIQSTNTSVVEPDHVESLIRKKAEKSYSDVYLRIVGIGNAEVSYKIGNQTYSTKVTVTPYENIIKSITLTNVNNGADFAGLTAESAYPKAEQTYDDETYQMIDNRLKLSETTRKAELVLKVIDGWDIRRVSSDNYNRKTPGIRSDSYNRIYSEDEEDEKVIGEQSFIFSELEKPTDEWTPFSLNLEVRNSMTRQTAHINYSIY